MEQSRNTTPEPHIGRLVTRRRFVFACAAGIGAAALGSGCTRNTSERPDTTADAYDGTSQFAQAPADAPAPSGDEASATNPDALAARLLLISDMHVSAAFDPSIGHAQGAFAAIGQFDPKPDAVIINGDITDHGQPEEYDLVEQLAAAEGLDFPQDFILIMGNHEQRGYTDEATSEALAAQRNLFMERCGVGHLYYDLEVNGVHVIALGPDADPQAWWAVRFTDKQLTWLDELLAKDAQRGRLAFVFTHQPINDTVAYTHDGELAYDSLESSDQLHDVVSKYDNVIVVSAHSHSPCDFYQPDASGPLYVADSAVAYLRTDPFVNWSEDGINYSRGLIADVYGNRIEFTSWDFVLNDEADSGGYTLQV